MKKFLQRIKIAIRRWLGLDETILGVDFGAGKDESCIVVASRLRNGTVRIIDAKFGSMEEVERFVKECQARYNVSEKQTFRDYPPGMARRSF